MPWLMIIQIVLLGLWYTVAPELPTWLVLLPTGLMAVFLFIAMFCLVMAIVVGKK